MAEGDKLPTFTQWLSEWLGFQIPGLPMPQLRKNLDKAVGRVIFAAGVNLEARIKGNTGMVKARGEVAIDGMFRTEEEERKFRNRIETTKKSIEDLSREPPREDATEEIADDWLNLFARIAEDKSSAELQELFGRILAGEMRKPGSFSLRTIQIMSTVSTKDAEAITTFFRYALDRKVVPFFTEVGPPYGLRLIMNELGVAGPAGRMVTAGAQNSVDAGQKKLLLMSKFGILVSNDSSATIRFSVGGQVLTTSGQELIPIAHLLPSDIEFVRLAANMVLGNIRENHEKEVQNNNITVEIIEITSMIGLEVRYKNLAKAPVAAKEQ